MAVKLNTKFIDKFISHDEFKNIKSEIQTAFDHVKKRDADGNDFLGWVDLPENYDRSEFERIITASKEISSKCDVFVVIGIGGSYLGARAAIDFVNGNNYNLIDKDHPAVYYAGNSLSSSSLADLLKICEGKDICINVISKSGTTTEPAIAFRIFRDYIEKKYGVEEAKNRIYVTTDKSKGKLKELADQKGYQTFVVPDDIGGRYSVLTAVGLLPIAVAGIDIESMMKGALDAKNFFVSEKLCENDALKYAAIRNILYRRGYACEFLATYEPSLDLFTEWWKQLYGESEGKEGKGIIPNSVVFSTDLHSLGQLIQEGKRNIFETVINISKSNDEIIIPDDENNSDGLNFLSGNNLEFVKNNAFLGTVAAHTDGEVPNIILDLDSRSAYDFGYIVYFFELACAVSGYTLGVNPFNQPGVEAYKNNMFALLGKPGYEDQKELLLKKIGND